MLRTVRTVIVDEIHAVLESRRGAHLALSLERLDHVARQPAAADRPLGDAGADRGGGGAGWSGSAAAAQRGSADVPRSSTKATAATLDLALELPGSPLEAVMSGEVWDEVYDRLAELIQAHRTTLVFVNTRRLAERVARHLAERLGEDAVTAHHGSLSKETRLDAEERLKSGKLKALVATASLELGHRHRPRGSGLPAGHAPADLHLPPAGGPLGAHGARHAQGPALPAHPRRAGRVHRAAPLGPARASSTGSIIREQAARRAGPADRGRDRGGGLGGGRAVRAGPAGLSLPRPAARRVRRRRRRCWPQGFATRRGRRGALIHHDAVNGRIRGRRGARHAGASPRAARSPTTPTTGWCSSRRAPSSAR